MVNLDSAIKIIPIVISSLALIVSLIGWNYSRINVRQTIKNSYMAALFDIDKQLTNNPILWTIYDEFPSGLTKDGDPMDKARRRAFIYHHFNLFEVTHTNYTQILFKNKIDCEFWDSMTNFIIQFFRTSAEARAIFKEDLTQELYLSDFLIFINKTIKDVEKTHS